MSLFSWMKRISKVAKGSRGFCFVPFLASYCAVLMCVSSCSQSSGVSNIGEKEMDDSGAHSGNDSESKGADGHLSEAVEQPSNNDFIDGSAIMPCGGLTIFGRFPLYLNAVDGQGHYTMRLNGKEMSPECLGAIVLNGFAAVGRRGVGNMNILEFDIFNRHTGDIEQFMGCFLDAMAKSPHFSPFVNDRLVTYAVGLRAINASKITYDDQPLGLMLYTYFRNILFELANGNLGLLGTKDIGAISAWRIKYYGDDDPSSSGINKYCYCLGQDIIDMLGDIQSHKTNPYADKECTCEDSIDTWFFKNRYDVHGYCQGVYYVLSKDKNISRELSFGWQDVAEVAKCIFAINVEISQ